MQRTIKSEVRFDGIGLHSGLNAGVIARPAPCDTGVVFRRGGELIPAHFMRVEHSPLCTALKSDSGRTISTIEHFMAAAWAMGIDNMVVDVSGPELPIMDGSALPFLNGFMAAGLKSQDAPVREIIVTRAVEYREGNSVCRLLPAHDFSADISIEFAHPAIGRQSASFDGSFENFVSDFGMTRTFCLEADVEAMKAAGKALGGSLDNAVVFGSEGIVNDNGLRIHQEPVRHKMLDAIGDLSLLGGRLKGRYEAERPGHKVTNMLLRTALEAGALYDPSGKSFVSHRDMDVIAA